MPTYDVGPFPAYLHDPNESVIYGIDWSNDLDPGDTITDSTWVAYGHNPDTVPTIDSPAFATTATTFKVSGGTNGAQYRFTNHITTASGQQYSQLLLLIVEEK